MSHRWLVDLVHDFFIAQLLFNGKLYGLWFDFDYILLLYNFLIGANFIRMYSLLMPLQTLFIIIKPSTIFIIALEFSPHLL